MVTVCIAGKNEIAVNALHHLIASAASDRSIDLCVLANRTDDGQTSWQPSLRRHAILAGVPEVSLDQLYSIQDLVFLSLEFDRLVRPDRFASRELFNIHFSALPKYKGMYTSIMPILMGETESGVTLHKIDRGIDTGDIIDQMRFPIERDDTGRDLYQKYLDQSFVLLQNNLSAVLSGEYQAASQDRFGGSYFSKQAIDFSNIQLDLNKTACEIHNQVRAFTFRDYQLPYFFGSPVCKSEVLNEKTTQKPGTVLSEDERCFEIATVDYRLRLTKDYYQEFWSACESGNIEDARTYSLRLPDLDLRNKSGWNGLIIATYWNNLRVVELLLNSGASIHTTNYRGTTIPMYAMAAYRRTGDDTMIRLVLSCNHDLRHRDENGKTISDYAVEYELPRMVELLHAHLDR